MEFGLQFLSLTALLIAPIGCPMPSQPADPGTPDAVSTSPQCGVTTSIPSGQYTGLLRQESHGSLIDSPDGRATDLIEWTLSVDERGLPLDVLGSFPPCAGLGGYEVIGDLDVREDFTELRVWQQRIEADFNLTIHVYPNDFLGSGTRTYVLDSTGLHFDQLLQATAPDTGEILLSAHSTADFAMGAP